MSTKLLLSIVLFLPPLLLQGATLEPFRAEYELKRNSLSIGRVELSLELKDQDSYLFRLHSKTTGMVSLIRKDVMIETSEGKIHQGLARPNHYRYQHDKGDKPRDMRLHFDWSSSGPRVEHWLNEERPWQLTIPPDTQDKMSQQLQLILSALAGRLELDMPVADGGKVKTYSYRQEESEMLETAAGGFQCIKMVRSKTGEDVLLTLWLGKEIHFIPVRMDRGSDGAVYSMRLNRLVVGREALAADATKRTTNSAPFKAWAE
jgi:hypothetical protein